MASTDPIALADPGTRRIDGSWLVVWAEVLLIFGIFALQGSWPVPDNNETHYLAKCRHFWQPEWLAGDVFLDSADAHQVFYFTCGWLTLYWPLATAAWIGRIATWALLATAWQRLSAALVPRRWFSVLAALLYCAAIERLHLAGEWVIGSFEAKGIAYALVWFALAEIARQRWQRAWLLLGMATAMHVLVGGWSLLAAGITWLTMRRQSPPLRQMMPALVVAALLALLGLVPAVAMSLGVEADIVREAKRIYVFERIPHHLWPQSFAAQRIWRYLALLLLYGALLPLYVPSVAERRVRRFVAAAIGFSVAGVLLALALQTFPTVAASVMRFYWFRLADAMLPLGVALTAVGYLAAARQMAERRTAARMLVGLMLFSAIGHFGHLVVNERLGTQVPRPERSQRTLSSEDWQAVCQWVAAHTPPESRVITPRQTITFLWRTERRQTPTWKDVPQSPRDIVLWRDQLEALHGTGLAPPADRWFASVAERGTEHAIELAREFEAQYILTYVYPRLALPVVYQNNSYCVYAVPRPPEPE